MTYEKFEELAGLPEMNLVTTIEEIFNNEGVVIDKYTREFMNEFVVNINEIYAIVYKRNSSYIQSIYEMNHELHEDENVEGCEQCKINNMTKDEYLEYFRPDYDETLHIAS